MGLWCSFLFFGFLYVVVMWVSYVLGMFDGLLVLVEQDWLEVLFDQMVVVIGKKICSIYVGIVFSQGQQ